METLFRTASKNKKSSKAHHKCKKALHCHKDDQCVKGYVCHIFKGLAIHVRIPNISKSMNARF